MIVRGHALHIIGSGLPAEALAISYRLTVFSRPAYSFPTTMCLLGPRPARVVVWVLVLRQDVEIACHTPPEIPDNKNTVSTVQFRFQSFLKKRTTRSPRRSSTASIGLWLLRFSC